MPIQATFRFRSASTYFLSFFHHPYPHTEDVHIKQGKEKGEMTWK